MFFGCYLLGLIARPSRRFAVSEAANVPWLLSLAMRFDRRFNGFDSHAHRAFRASAPSRGSRRSGSRVLARSGGAEPWTGSNSDVLPG
jgi:hypothetical protein